MPPTPLHPIPPPDSDPAWPLPILNIRVDDLSHPGATVFFHAVHPTEALKYAVEASFKWLYATLEKAPTNVLSILLVLRPMPGVAHTFGSHTHKEIHFSLDHIHNSASSRAKNDHNSASRAKNEIINAKNEIINAKKEIINAKKEIMGVLVHEVVHCYQYNARGTAPGGLIEGVADFVRLRAALAPPHWTRVADPNGRWDAGYQTTAYFLDWLDRRYGGGTVRELNGMMEMGDSGDERQEGEGEEEEEEAPGVSGVSAAQTEDAAPPPQASAVVIAGEEAVSVGVGVEEAAAEGKQKKNEKKDRKEKKEKKKEWNDKVFKKLTGRRVDKLWRIYCAECAEGTEWSAGNKGAGGKTSTEERPTHVASTDASRASASSSPKPSNATDSELDDFEIL